MSDRDIDDLMAYLHWLAVAGAASIFMYIFS